MQVLQLEKANLSPVATCPCIFKVIAFVSRISIITLKMQRIVENECVNEQP